MLMYYFFYSQMHKTDFSNNSAMESLLCQLTDTFCEFKCHEDIENNFIMEKLQNRMHSLDINDETVCNCHTNSKLSEVSSLLSRHKIKKKNI